MAKEGKRSKGKIVAIVIVVLVAFGVIGSMGGKKTTTTAPSDSSAQQEQPADASKDDAEKGDAAKDDKAADSTENLAVGTTVNLPSGLSVTVDSVEPGLVNYDGSAITGVHVTYVNNGDDGESYNVYDWKGEDANGAQQSTAYLQQGHRRPQLRHAREGRHRFRQRLLRRRPVQGALLRQYARKDGHGELGPFLR